MMSIGAHAAQSREMFHGRTNIERIKAAHISQTNFGYRDRIAGYRALADERVEVKSILACCGTQVQDGGEILIHAEFRELPPVHTPELFSPLCSDVCWQ